MSDRTCTMCDESYEAKDGHECRTPFLRAVRMLRDIEAGIQAGATCPSCGERGHREQPDCAFVGLLSDLP